MSASDPVLHITSIYPHTCVSFFTYVQKLENAGVGWVTELLNAAGVSASDPVFNGKYYQAQSHIPSKGPCYPVWLGTTDLYNR